ncbi:MAG: 4-hydroxy-tetrahydrodipicolinate reductase [SAR86 cluster bacterium]|uniref:4-hydroxy-tetrahydrodipicolinate reductase n=1 Tax=SAR86 cluster bacterium TaxID=2030880 RepID=A0A520MAU1_9GAMM|nr:MAG: 4-hydroxy-tetrahydrodipicolinate reductase [SAR86 cluster bacterium]
MTGIFINGLSGKMGTSLLNRSNLDNNIFICKDIDDKEVEVVIDFSHPSSTIETLDAIKDTNLSIIIGTTGFDDDQISYIKESSKYRSILFAYNLSKGISILKDSIKGFVESNSNNLSCRIEETHHTQKIDSPSGTAIALKDLVEFSDSKNLIKEIKIDSKRVGNIFGIHKVIFFSELEKIKFSHEAISRNIYSDGAIDATHWIKDQKNGMYSFENFFNSEDLL